MNYNKKKIFLFVFIIFFFYYKFENKIVKITIKKLSKSLKTFLNSLNVFFGLDLLKKYLFLVNILNFIRSPSNKIGKKIKIR